MHVMELLYVMYNVLLNKNNNMMLTSVAFLCIFPKHMLRNPMVQFSNHIDIIFHCG